MIRLGDDAFGLGVAEYAGQEGVLGGLPFGVAGRAPAHLDGDLEGGLANLFAVHPPVGPLLSTARAGVGQRFRFVVDQNPVAVHPVADLVGDVVDQGGVLGAVAVDQQGSSKGKYCGLGACHCMGYSSGGVKRVEHFVVLVDVCLMFCISH